VLNEQGVKIHLAAPVTSIRPAANLAGAPSESDNRSAACEVKSQRADGSSKASVFDLVLFTAPPRVARKVVSPELLPHVERMEAVYPTSSAYLGVACGVFVLREPLTPYYVLNLADPDVELTGLIEMTNLVDSGARLREGRSSIFRATSTARNAVLREERRQPPRGLRRARV
jgi:protoporphyrinogen oxidase